MFSDLVRFLVVVSFQVYGEWGLDICFDVFDYVQQFCEVYFFFILIVKYFGDGFVRGVDGFEVKFFC